MGAVMHQDCFSNPVTTDRIFFDENEDKKTLSALTEKKFLFQIVAFHDFINESVFECFFGIHPVITFAIFMNFFDGLT